MWGQNTVLRTVWDQIVRVQGSHDVILKTRNAFRVSDPPCDPTAFRTVVGEGRKHGSGKRKGCPVAMHACMHAHEKKKQCQEESGWVCLLSRLLCWGNPMD